MEGWGAFSQGQMTGGCWEECEKCYHINFLELPRSSCSLLCSQDLYQRKAKSVSLGQVEQCHDSIPSEQDGRYKIRGSYSPDKEDMRLVPITSRETQYQSGLLFKELIGPFTH